MNSPLKLTLLAALWLPIGSAYGADIPPPIPDSPVPVDAQKLPPPTSANADLVESFRNEQLTPGQIVEIRRIIRDARRGNMMPIEGYFQATPVNRVLRLDMSPGVAPPIIRIGDKQGCSMTFSDANGKEWPVLNYTNFTPTVMTVKRPVEGSSLITVEPADTSGMGNLAIFLRGPSGDVIPVSFSVLTEQKEADYVISVVIPRILTTGGGADGSVATSTTTSGEVMRNESLELALAGISPPNSLKLKSTDERVEAWKMRKGDSGKFNIVIRSRAALMSPAPLSGRSMTSRDGTRAYEIDYTPMITILSGGNSQMVKLSEPEN